MSISKGRKTELIKKFAINTADTGSVHVQCAVLTERIVNLTVHSKENPKDFQSRRGLLVMVNRRKRLLAYYKKIDATAHAALIAELGLRK